MNELTLKIDNDHALVLFEFFAEFSEGKRPVSGLLNAERLAFEHLEAALESTLVEPFEENYTDLVMRARGRVDACSGE